MDLEKWQSKSDDANFDLSIFLIIEKRSFDLLVSASSVFAGEKSPSLKMQGVILRMFADWKRKTHVVMARYSPMMEITLKRAKMNINIPNSVGGCFLQQRLHSTCVRSPAEQRMHHLPSFRYAAVVVAFVEWLQVSACSLITGVHVWRHCHCRPPRGQTPAFESCTLTNKT